MLRKTNKDSSPNTKRTFDWQLFHCLLGVEVEKTNGMTNKT